MMAKHATNDLGVSETAVKGPCLHVSRQDASSAG